jgi:hypothetical protein
VVIGLTYIPSIRTCIDFNNDDISKLDYCEDNYIELICINYDQVDNINKILKKLYKNKHIYFIFYSI